MRGKALLFKESPWCWGCHPQLFPPSLFCYATQALSGQSCRAVQGPCARNSSTFNYLQQMRTPRGAGCREGWRLLVCEKQSWALEGAWAFANGRRSLQRAGGRASGARAVRAGTADAAGIPIRKPAWSHWLRDPPAVWGSLRRRRK